MDRRQQLAATVFHGKDGWLFHRDDFAVEQVAGVRPLPEGRVAQWRELLEARHRWVAARGAHYVFCVVPDKYVIYPDKVIDGFQIAEARPARQIERSLVESASGVSMVYPVAPLVSERARRDTYFSTDTHWNMFGAYLGYRELALAIDAQRPLGRVLAEDDIVFDTREFDGDLAVRLDPEPTSEGLFGTLRSPKARGIGGNGVFARGSVLVFEQPDASLPRAVVFRDSFANMLLPLLAESFSRMVAVSSVEMYRELIESEGADVVITEVAERLLNQPALPSLDGVIPDDVSAPSFDVACKMTIQQVASMKG